VEELLEELRERNVLRRVSPLSSYLYWKHSSDPDPKMTKHLKGVQIFAKAEWLNPGGSVKDRAGLRIIEDGERSGQLSQG
jgi:cysteine synthase